MICGIVCAVVVLLIIAVLILPFLPQGSAGIVAGIFVVSIAAYVAYEIINYKPRIPT